MLRKALLAVCVLFLLPALVLAQDGKLRGKVTDKESGDPLIGANVTLDGTSLGAAADLNGDYVILGVPPGVYTVKVSYIGYQPVSLANVRVSAGLTTTQDFKLSSSAIEVGSLEVVAERPLIQRNTTNTVRLTTTEDIQNLPIRGLQNILALNAGTVQQDGTLHIRGGRMNEVAYFVDGVSATNPLFNTENISVVQEAVEELQLQSGGFTAEFGGANSGVVRTTLKTGGSSFKATVDYRTDDFAKPGEKFLGTTSRGDRIAVVTAGGPVGAKLRYFVTGQHRYMRNRTSLFVEPFSFANLVDDGLVTGRNAGRPLPDAVQFKRNFLPNNQLYDNQGQLTMVYNMSNALKFRFTGSYQFQRFPLGYSSFPGALGNMFSNRQDRTDVQRGLGGLKFTHLVNANTFYEVNVNYTARFTRTYDPDFGDDWIKYSDSRELQALGYDVSEWQSLFQGPLNYSTIFKFQFTPRNRAINSYSKDNQQSMGGSIDFTTQLNKNTELKVGGRMDYWTMRSYSVGDIGSLLNYLYGVDGKSPRTFPNEYQRTVETASRGSIFYMGYDVDGKNKINSGVDGPRHPLFASAYAQSKWEYRDLVLNLGLRYERIDAKILRPINPEVQPGDYDATNLFIKKEAVTETDPYDFLLPRVNFSFPVTERTVFYAQYGKYIQMPNLSDLYRGGIRSLSRDVLPETRSLYGFFGQYVGFTAQPERTDQYELGIRQTLSDNFAFTVTAFYKNLRDQLRFDRYLADGTGKLAAGTPIFVGWINNDFGTAKGLEMTLELRRVKRLSARVNYTLSSTRGTGSDSRSTRVAVSDATTTSYPTLIYNLDYNQPHRGTILLDYRYGKNDGGKILQGLGMNAILSFNSGHNYTKIREPLNLGQANAWNVGMRATQDPRTRNPVEPINTSITPWTFNVDLNIEKLVYLSSFNLKVYANVLNAFNSKNIINLYPTTGTDDDDGWLKNPLAGQYTVIPNYEAFYRAINLENRWGYQNVTGNDLWSAPRQIRLGLMAEF
jgi:outer membrane receptor protein involved in Fe transport